MFCFGVFEDDFLSRLRPSSTSGPATQTTSIPEPSVGDKANEKRPMEGAPPLGTPPPKESNVQPEGAALSSSKTPVGETPRKDSTDVPKNPLDEFAVPLVGTPCGEGSFNPSGLFPWIAGLGPMLDEI